MPWAELSSPVIGFAGSFGRVREEPALDECRDFAPVSFLVAGGGQSRARPSRAEHVDGLERGGDALEANHAYRAAAFEDVGERALVSAGYLVKGGAILRPAREVADFVVEDGERLAITVDDIERRAHDGEEFTARVALALGAERGQRFEQFGNHRFGKQQQDVVLALQVDVDGAGGEAGLERHLLDGSLME